MKTLESWLNLKRDRLEIKERDRAKFFPISTTLATINVVEELNTFETHHTPSPCRLTNGIVHASTLGKTSPHILESTQIVVEVTRENDNIALHNKSPTLFDNNDLDFDDCNLSEVIKILQRMARDPNTSKLNLTFTEHITNALIKAREEKLKLQTTIPRKLEDGWDPTIKIKINDFACNALRDLGGVLPLCQRDFMI